MICLLLAERAWSELFLLEGSSRETQNSARLDFTEPTHRKRMGNLVVEDDTHEGAVHLQPLVRPTVVLNEAQIAELIQKEIDAGARGADHLGQCFLTDLGDDRLHLAFFPKNGPLTAVTAQAVSRWN